MRYYNRQHRFYGVVDLHGQTMYLCILDQQGTIFLHKDLPTEPGAFLEAVAPFRDDLVVCCECLFCWYWLSDLCHAENSCFVLGRGPLADESLLTNCWLPGRRAKPTN